MNRIILFVLVIIGGYFGICTGAYVALFVLASLLYALVELSDLFADKMQNLIFLLMMYFSFVLSWF